MRTWYGAVVGDIGTSEGGHNGKIRSTAWQGLLTRSCSWSRMARRDGDGGGGQGRGGGQGAARGHVGRGEREMGGGDWESAAGAMRRRYHGAATTTTTTASLFMAVRQ